MMMAEKLRFYFDNASDQPLYNIKAACTRTNIPTATLRAWERRYGVPQPTRSQQGYRLYSERDIAILLWIQEQLQNGMSIARAIRQFNQLIDSQAYTNEESAISDDSNVMHLSPVTAISNNRPTSEATSLPQYNDPLYDAIRSPSVLRHELFDAIVNQNETQINRLFSESLALYTFDTTLLNIVYGTIQDVRASSLLDSQSNSNKPIDLNFVQQQLNSLLQKLPLTPPDKQSVTLIGFSNEYTEIDRLIIKLLLRHKNIPAMLLTIDTNLVVQDFSLMLSEHFTDTAIGLIVCYTNDLKSLADLLPTNAAAAGRLPIAWGCSAPGRPSMVKEPPAWYLGATLRDIIQNIIISMTVRGFSHDPSEIYGWTRLEHAAP